MRLAFIAMLAIGLVTPIALTIGRPTGQSVESQDVPDTPEITLVLDPDQPGLPEGKRQAMIDGENSKPDGPRPSGEFVPSPKEYPWPAFGDRGPEEEVRRLRERAPELLESEARATIVTREESVAALAQRGEALSLPEEQRVSWVVADRAASLVRDVWVQEVAPEKAEEERSAMILGLLGPGYFTGYNDIWLEVVSWNGVEVSGDQAKASLVGRYHRRINPSPVVSGPEESTDQKTQYDLRLGRGPDGVWRLRSIDETKLEFSG